MKAHFKGVLNYDPWIGADLEQRVAGRAGADLTASKVPVGAAAMAIGVGTHRRIAGLIAASP